MTDEATENDTLEVEETGDDSKSRKGGGGYERLALRELRQAKRAVSSGEGDASMHIQTAHALALLDLASAIRATKSTAEAD
jgi:hypothetical protein